VLSSAASCLWKSFRRSRTQLLDRPETVRLHPGTGVHLHPGILFEIIPERRSESSRNRVHLAPDSPPITPVPRIASWAKLGPFRGRSLTALVYLSDQGIARLEKSRHRSDFDIFVDRCRMHLNSQTSDLVHFKPDCSASYLAVKS